jgi:hypothetical protein
VQILDGIVPLANAQDDCGNGSLQSIELAEGDVQEGGGLDTV